LSHDKRLTRWVTSWAATYDASADSVLSEFQGADCLDLQGLTTISTWKLRRLWPAQAERRLRQNEDELVRDLTRRAIANSDDVAALAMLTMIHGIAPRTASAVLMAMDPHRYYRYGRTVLELIVGA